MVNDTLGVDVFTLEPTRRFLGTLTFENIPNAEIIVYSFNLSKTSSDPIEVRRHAEVSYYPGRITPDEITAGVYLFQGQLDQLKQAFFQKTYDPDNGKLGLANVIRKSATMRILGPDGSEAGSVQLTRAWVTSIDIGNISWRENDIIEATLTIRFDKISFKGPTSSQQQQAGGAGAGGAGAGGAGAGGAGAGGGGGR